MSSSIITSVLTGGSNSAQTVAEELNAYATDFVTQGVVGGFNQNSGAGGTGSFSVNADASPDMGVTVKAGQAYVAGTPSGQDAQVLRARMSADYTSYTINANSSGSTKYDFIYLKLDATNSNNPTSAKDNAITLYTSRSSSNSADNGSPPTYGLLLAIVTVANGAASITNANIADRRIGVTLGATSNATTTGWTNLGYSLTYAANNGNKEFTVTTPNNITNVVSPGMKLQVTRSVTPPTQCMAFSSASSQYATKASPTGITFTSAFTCEAWVYLNSYPTGSNPAGIISQWNSTNGWVMYINSSGQLQGQYTASSAATIASTYQSIPLNQWTHVAYTATTASKTTNFYINGVLVPSLQSASAATTLTQAATPLQIGAFNNAQAGSFLNGYVFEARVWSVAQTQTQIQNNMAINLVGNETNLVALFQGNGNFNDATSNANNLTATGGAIATQANNPYNAIEYAVVTKVAYSNPNTTLTLFAGNSNTIPNQTLNSPQYSTARAPFGFPAGRDNWETRVTIKARNSITTSASTWVNPGSYQISIPSGSWDVGYQVVTLVTGASQTFLTMVVTLSTTNNGESDSDFSAPGAAISSATGEQDTFVSKEKSLSLNSQTTYFLNTISPSSTPTLYIGTNPGSAGSPTSLIRARCAYI